jgi:hypothetical protein
MKYRKLISNYIPLSSAVSSVYIWNHSKKKVIIFTSTVDLKTDKRRKDYLPILLCFFYCSKFPSFIISFPDALNFLPQFPLAILLE